MTTCEEVRIALGAHALGALDPDEALEIDLHLAGCEACGAELVELEGVSAFLGKVSEHDVALVAGPPRQVLDRLLSEARAKKRRTRRVLQAVAASAAAIVLGGTVWTAVDGRGGGDTAASAPAAPAMTSGPEDVPSAPEEANPLIAPDRQLKAEPSPTRSSVPEPRATEQKEADQRATEQQEADPLATEQKATEQRAAGRTFTGVGGDRRAPVRAVVRATPDGARTELSVRLSGVSAGATCEVVVVARGGERYPTGSWTVTRRERAGAPDHVVEAPVALAAVSRFDVVDSSGRVLVRVPVPGRD